MLQASGRCTFKKARNESHEYVINIKTASSTDLVYRKSGSFVSKYVVCE